MQAKAEVHIAILFSALNGLVVQPTAT